MMASALAPEDRRAVALPFDDGLIIVGADNAVYALDAGGRRLWEALGAGWGETDLADACVREGGLTKEAAYAYIQDTLALWQGFSLLEAPLPDDVNLPAR